MVLQNVRAYRHGVRRRVRRNHRLNLPPRPPVATALSRRQERAGSGQKGSRGLRRRRGAGPAVMDAPGGEIEECVLGKRRTPTGTWCWLFHHQRGRDAAGGGGGESGIAANFRSSARSACVVRRRCKWKFPAPRRSDGVRYRYFSQNHRGPAMHLQVALLRGASATCGGRSLERGVHVLIV